jgi:hypothetical protein
MTMEKLDPYSQGSQQLKNQDDSQVREYKLKGSLPARMVHFCFFLDAFAIGLNFNARSIQ